MLAFFQKGEVILDFDSSHQSKQTGELKDISTSFIYFVSDGTRADSGNTNHLTLINHLPLPYGQNLQQILAKFTVQLPSRFK